MTPMNRIISGLGLAIVLAMPFSAGEANAQQQSLTISNAANGGDCTRFPLNGSWDGRTCTFSTLTIQPHQGLNIRGTARVRVISQTVNDGIIAVAEAGELVVQGAFVNRGALVIMPAPGFSSPGVSNRGQMQNSGSVFNANRNGTSGIFNNFGTIRNSGQMRNEGFFHNSGPPVQATKAVINNIGDGFFHISGGVGNARLENRGEITGRVI